MGAGRQWGMEVSSFTNEESMRRHLGQLNLGLERC